jgi:hypothetical protein
MKIISIGSDPEFFVLDRNGRPYPATPFAKGTKDNPAQIPGLPNGFFEQRDNLSFEGNIPISKTFEEFYFNMCFIRNFFQNKVTKFGYSLSPNGVEYFDKRYLKTPEGMEFGCSSVVSSWDSQVGYYSERPTPVLNRAKYRVAGFHIHIGFVINCDINHKDMAILVGRLFDLFITMPSQLVKPEPERIQSYGQYGMIRIKPYGVECRTLSSYFTQDTQLKWVWDQLFKIEQFINSCNVNDLKILISIPHFTGTSVNTLRRIFYDLFKRFTDPKPLTLFTETNEIYTSQQFVKTNSYTYTKYNVTSSTSKATSTW